VNGRKGKLLPSTMVTEQRRVLVVDDHRERREALCELLSTWGFEAEEADDGKHAYLQAERRRPRPWPA
jgi:CheY-like chemotaxis protein